MVGPPCAMLQVPCKTVESMVPKPDGGEEEPERSRVNAELSTRGQSAPTEAPEARPTRRHHRRASRSTIPPRPAGAKASATLTHPLRPTARRPEEGPARRTKVGRA